MMKGQRETALPKGPQPAGNIAVDDKSTVDHDEGERRYRSHYSISASGVPLHSPITPPD
jgi:hypothetical protein